MTAFEVVGESFYKRNIMAVGVKNDDYYLPKKQLLEEYDEGDTIPQYEFGNLFAEVEREPENPHDPNALKVMIDGKQVGYIARKDQPRAEPYLDDPNIIWKASITYGPFKEVVEDDDGELTVEKRDFDFSILLAVQEISLAKNS